MALGLGVFVLYAATAYRSVGGGDSGELTVVAATLGVAHPPGYPLFTLLGKLFTRLPVGSVAYRVHLLGAACGALAAALLAAAVVRWARDVGAGLFAGGLFALSPLVWTYATTAEVFPLHNLFVAGLVYLSVRLAEGVTPALVRAGALWIGLGLANHHMLAFYAAPFLAWLLWRAPEWRTPKRLGLVAGLVAAGLLPYLYLPIAGARAPLVAWGDPTTVSGFVRHVLRADYGTLQLGTERTVAEGAALGRLWLFVRTLPRELFYVGVPLAALGLARSLRAERHLGALWLLAFLVYAVAFAFLSNLGLEAPLAVTVQSRFWQQSLLPLCAWAGLGLTVLVRGRVAAVVSIAVLLVAGAVRYPAQDQGASRVFHDYGRAVLKTLPPRAILLTQGDHLLGTLRYTQIVDGCRPDVAVLDLSVLAYAWARPWAARHFPDVTLPKTGVYAADGYSLRDFADANRARRPVFVINGVREWDHSLRGAYVMIPAGLSVELVPAHRGEYAVDVARLRAANETVFSDLDPKALAAYAPSTWESLVHRNYWRSYEAYGVELLTWAAREIGAERAVIDQGLAILERCARESPYVDVSVYKNLGLGYRLLVPADPAAAFGAIRSWRRFLESAPPDRPDVALIRAELRRLEEGVGR